MLIWTKFTARFAASLAVASCLFIAGCASGAATPPSHGGTSSAAASSSAATSLSSSPSAQPTSQVSGFQPVGASFISADTGWALGTSGCSSCAQLLQTSDGGRRWQALAVPPAPIGSDGSPAGSVSNVAFADAANGFLYGPGLLVSHDGGRSWSRQSLPPVEELVLGGGYAYAMTVTPNTMVGGLWRAAIGASTWTRLRLPGAASAPVAYSAPNGQQILHADGGTLALLRPGVTAPVNTASTVGDLWVSTSDGTAWQARPVPCRAPRGGGAAALSMALGHPDAWLLDCFNNEQSSQQQNTQHILFGTVNDGLTWVQLPDPTSHDMPVLLADNGSGHAFLAVQGAGDFMVGTFDGGLHWQQVIASGGSFSGWADLAFVNAQTGFVVGAVTDYGHSHLYRTDDGGRSWQIVQF